ncbi:MAG TPA: carbohydrate-binding family 9-like protein [Verrucomicrobiae bacterium]|jgi:hypothetical protein
MSDAPTYSVAWAATLPRLEANWDDPAWQAAETAGLANFRPEGSDHRPAASLRLLHDGQALRGIYLVRDRYVRSIRTNYFDEVWNDSCVEIFLQPRPESGYFNLEMNAGGAHLCNYIEDPERVPGGFKKSTRLPPEIGLRIKVRSSLPKIVDPEIAEPVEWQLNFFAPLDVFEHYCGPLGGLRGQRWRGNFYKCGDEGSHPHWGSWAPVDVFNFHLPRCFGTLCFL